MKIQEKRAQNAPALEYLTVEGCHLSNGIALRFLHKQRNRSVPFNYNKFTII